MADTTGIHASPSVYYETVGAGPAIVLISGLGGMANFWADVVAALRDRFKVITFDHPGVGRSASCENHSIDQIADAVLEILDREGIDRAHMVGHSTGGLVAQALALDHRERCDTVVLSGAWASPDQRFRDLFAFRQYLLEKGSSGAYATFSRLSGYDTQWYDDVVAPKLPLDLSNDVPLDVEGTRCRIQMLLSYSRADELPDMTIRALIVGAVDDFIIPMVHSVQLEGLIPGARRIVLDGGHFFPQSRRAAFVAAITQFLEHP